MSELPVLMRYLLPMAVEKLQSLPARQYDFLILGGGIAGLWAALCAVEHGKVAIATKSYFGESNTRYAQGGLAAALDEQDSPHKHFEDTVKAGAGLCNEEAARILAEEAPACVLKLREMGVQFDEEDGQLRLGREGAHTVRRIIHARGDETGHEISRTLLERVRAAGIEFFEGAFAVDLLTLNGECIGALILEAGKNEPTVFLAKATLLCTGGAGQIYSATTNPAIATGDGMAMAFRAGAEMMDMEFVQFHPTALVEDKSPRLLISEAVRGEGAILKNVWGEEFMPKHHPERELAPRDVVARAIFKEMQRTGADHVLLDISHRGEEFVRSRFPMLCRECWNRGFGMGRQPIPVAPAAHYFMGGVRTDLWGRTNIKRLLAAGEVACTGLHGANRLASNSLTEGLVFGGRAVRGALEWLKKPLSRISDFRFQISDELLHKSEIRNPKSEAAALRRELQILMSRCVGIIRSEQTLQEAFRELEELARQFPFGQQDVMALETANMLTVALLVTRAALNRTESRGGHYRQDFPERDDENWRKHTVLKAREYDGFLIMAFQPSVRDEALEKKGAK